MSLQSDALTGQFYEWEKRGRGWYLFDTPVDLEPPFDPFFFHALPVSRRAIDDGRKETVLSRIAGLFKDQPRKETSYEEEPVPLEAFQFENDEEVKSFSVILPKGYEIGMKEMDQLLLMLSYTKAPLSFEIFGSDNRISFQFAARESDIIQVKSQLKAYFPLIVIEERADLFNEVFQLEHYTSVVDLGLRDEFMRPLRVADYFNPDPLIGVCATLENLNENEFGVVQVLFKGTINPWAPSVMRSVLDNEGGSFFENAPEMVSLAKAKVASPLFGVTIRILGCSNSKMSAESIVQGLCTTVVRLYSSPTNNLIPLYDQAIDFRTYLDDILLRETHRIGMLLNLRELATLVHLPSDSVVSSKLERVIKRTKTAPKETQGHPFVLGINEHNGKEKEVSVSSNQRLRHSHIIGATGTGKSTFLLNLIVEDINQGNGIAVLDPHGDLIESILPYVPESRINDVVLIDPADAEYPIGFNILQAHSEIEKEILSSDLVAGFKRLSTSWGDQMNSVFANAILAFLESPTGGTLADLRRFLVEKTFRDEYLKTVSDSNIRYYWQKEYPLLRTNSIGPILTRLDTFLRPKLIRNMVSQKKSLDFDNLLSSKKIILIKLSQGLIGTENSYLLGTVILSKIHQAAMARQAIAKDIRSNFFVYIDEFQNFITPSMAAILSGARKYHLGLILAHQDMQQLLKYDNELASSVMANAGTRICFRLGDMDAKRFADGFSFFESEDLQNLQTGQAIVRIDKPENDFNLSIIPVLEPDQTSTEKVVKEIFDHSRFSYGTPKSEVESQLQTAYEPLIETKVAEVPLAVVQKEEKVKPLPIIYETPPPREIIESTTLEQLIKQKEITEHRSLQMRIKRMAEDRGFKANIEEPLTDGGRIDVSLELNQKRIACEICVKSGHNWEVHNIQKCLAAGYDVVIECSTKKSTLTNIEQKVLNAIEPTMIDRVLFLEPEQLFLYLDEIVSAETRTESKVKGYRVKVNYSPVSDNEMILKRENTTKILVNSTKKKK